MHGRQNTGSTITSWSPIGPRRPLVGRPEHRDHRPAERRREVHGARVIRDEHASRAGRHADERAQARATQRDSRRAEPPRARAREARILSHAPRRDRATRRRARRSRRDRARGAPSAPPCDRAATASPGRRRRPARRPTRRVPRPMWCSASSASARAALGRRARSRGALAPGRRRCRGRSRARGSSRPDAGRPPRATRRLRRVSRSPRPDVA